MTEAAPDGVTLDAGINQSLRLVDTGAGIGRVLKFQALRQIPAQCVISIPVKGFDKAGVDDDIALALRTILEFIELSVDIGTERKCLGKRIEVKVAEQLQPLRFQPFLISQRTDILRIVIERIAQFPLVGEFIVELHIHIMAFHFGIGIRKIEVFNIPRTDFDRFVKIAFLSHIHKIHILPSDIIGCHVADGVSLMGCFVCPEVFLQFHVRVERIIFRNGDILREVVMQGDADVPLFREERLACFKVRCEVDGVECLSLCFGHRLLQTAETGSGVGT